MAGARHGAGSAIRKGVCSAWGIRLFSRWKILPNADVTVRHGASIWLGPTPMLRFTCTMANGAAQSHGLDFCGVREFRWNAGFRPRNIRAAASAIRMTG